MNTTQLIFEIIKLYIMTIGIVIPLIFAVFQMKKNLNGIKPCYHMNLVGYGLKKHYNIEK